MWVNKTVQEIEIVMIKEEEVVEDHNQEVSLEEEEEVIVARGTMTIAPTERTTPIARTMTMMMGTTHPNPRSSVLPRMSRVEQKN